MKINKFIFLGSIFLLLPIVVSAAYLNAGEIVSGQAASSTPQNVYLAGGTVSVTNEVAGDLSAVGGTVNISGDVEKDVLVLGGNVNIIGGSAEDVRVAGGNLTIGGEISGEVMVAGGQVTITEDAVITKDSYIAGGSVVFMGKEEGNLSIAGGTVQINGVVNGNVTITHADHVVFGSKSVIKGKIEYSSPTEALIESGSQISENPIFHKIQGPKEGMNPKFFAALLGTFVLFKFIAILFAACLLWYARKNDMQAIIREANEKLWMNALRGFGFLVIVPVASVFLFFTVIGWVPAVVLLASYVSVLVLASPVAAILATSFLLMILKKDHMEFSWYYIILGLLAFKIVGSVPLIGWLACFLVYLMAVGGILSVLKSKFKS